MKVAPVKLVPIANLTPAAARAELKRTHQFLRGREPLDTVKMLKALATRFMRLQLNGLLTDEDITGALWEAAEACGLIDHTSVGAVQEIINAAFEHARDKPYDDPAAAVTIEATPWEFIDPAQIPRRRWLSGTHLIRKFGSATIAAPGVGKSALKLVEAVAIATGSPLLGILPAVRAQVWYWNGEDPLEEIQRRIAAICLHYNIAGNELEGWLFIDSGREQEIIIARQTQ